MFQKDWQLSDSLWSVSQEVFNDSFKWPEIFERNNQLLNNGSNFTFENIFSTPSVSERIQIPDLSDLENRVNKVLVGAGGRITLNSRQGQLFLDFSQITDKNSVVGRIANLLNIPVKKVIDFRL